MRVIIDKNIPLPDALFRDNAGITRAAGAEITPDLVRNADALLVRSVTKVNEKLLHGSAVRFVGTATIGEDHIDTDYLRSRGIAFASAPGSNANSVAEYVVAALLVLASRLGFTLEGKVIGVVGVGNVGGRVVKMSKALGMRVLMNDPPLARTTGDRNYLALDELMAADIVTLHVPLTERGEDATWHFFDERRLSLMKRGSILINTSRGAVVATNALTRALRSGALGSAILDVWEDEPSIDMEALSLAAIGTAHIAGYSADGKINGARMIYTALCEHFGWTNDWENAGPHPPDPEVSTIAVNAPVENLQAALHDIVRRCYPIERDDAGLRILSSLPAGERAAGFNNLRLKYPQRREFPAVTVSLPPNEIRLQGILDGLGFRTVRG